MNRKTEFALVTAVALAVILGIARAHGDVPADPTFLPDYGYHLSDAGSAEEAERLYDGLTGELTRDRKRILCYQRAKVWAAQLERQGIASGKVFLIYTAWGGPNGTYGRTGEKWAWHVAPYIVAGGVEYVMEKFGTARELMTLAEWERLHTGGANCKNTSLAEDRDILAQLNINQSIHYQGVPCYVRKTPPGFNIPMDIYQHDIQGHPVGYELSGALDACLGTIGSGGRSRCQEILSP